MLEEFLFEIECAEKIGDYKTADVLDHKLLKLAQDNHTKVKRLLSKKFNTECGVKDISYSNYQDKFVISADYSITDSTKTKIKNLAKPFKVSFRFSQASFDPESHTINQLDEEFPGDEWIDPFDIDREPTDEEIDFTSEFPDSHTLVQDFLQDLRQDKDRLYDFVKKMAEKGYDYQQLRDMYSSLKNFEDNLFEL